MGGRAERLHPLLSAIPLYLPPTNTHTHPLSLLSALGDLSDMQQAAPQASLARKQGRPPGSGRLILVNISFRVCVRGHDTDLIVWQCFGLSQKEEGNHPGVRRASQRMPQPPEHFKANPPK